MKNLIVNLICLVSVLSANAQTAAGSFMLGGGISASSSKTEFDGDEIDSESTIAFGPSVGYFVSDGLAVGLNLTIEKSSYTDFDPNFGDYEVDVNGLSVGAFIRYYKFTSSESFAFFAQGSFTYLTVESEYSNAGDSQKIDGSGLDLAISPGFAYFFNDKWSAELLFRGIAYSSVKPNEDNDDYKQTEMTIGLDSLTPTLAVRLYLSK
jgi:outer membrane protein